MKRTTVQVEEGLYLEMKQLADRAGSTPTRMIREAMAEYVVAHREETQVPSFAASGASGRHDVSQRAEEILAEDVGKDGWPG